MFLTLQSDIPKARACLTAECRGDVLTACITAVILCGVRTLQDLPDDFCFNAEPVSEISNSQQYGFPVRNPSVSTYSEMPTK
jgi:hypothetical protein